MMSSPVPWSGETLINDKPAVILIPSNLNNALNAVYWWEFFREVQDVKGDIVECGVGRGRSLITLSAINKLTSVLEGCGERKIFAFDSFQGFPEPTFNDKSPRNPKKAEN